MDYTKDLDGVWTVWHGRDPMRQRPLAPETVEADNNANEIPYQR